MAGPTTSKVCGLCGADCSNKPRTKDQSGKYFCKECYERALARKRGEGKPNAHRPAETAKARSQSPAVAADVGDFGMLDELLSQQNDEAGVAAKPTHACSNCGAPMAGDAVICVSCGFNSQSGKAMNVTVKRAPREPMLGDWKGPLIFGAIVMAIFVALAIFARADIAAAGLFALLWLLSSLAYLLWVVRAAGNYGGLVSAALVFFIPLFYLYFVFAQHKGRYLRVATACQLMVAALFIATLPAFEKLSKEADQQRHDMLNRPRSSPMNSNG